ncbi:MAG: hypothetical protein HY817_04510 [Candidatus Abawacabacteria bacterium]|nr:hypothetical protein [Candidatus Abawacabacteria bacterium]
MRLPYLLELMAPGSSTESSDAFTPRLPGTDGTGTRLNVYDLNLTPGNTDIKVIINELVAYAIILAGFLAIVYLLWGGLQYIISGGKEDKVKTATNTIKYAIIGLVITILSVSIINFISRIFNLDLVNYVNFAHILDIINNLLNFRFT